MPKFCPLVPWQSLYILYTFSFSRYKGMGSRGRGQKRAKKRRNGSTTGFIGVSFCPLTPEHLFFFGDKIFLWKSRKPSNHKGLKAFFWQKILSPTQTDVRWNFSNIRLFDTRLSLDFTGFLVGDKMKMTLIFCISSVLCITICMNCGLKKFFTGNEKQPLAKNKQMCDTKGERKERNFRLFCVNSLSSGGRTVWCSSAVSFSGPNVLPQRVLFPVPEPWYNAYVNS